MATSVEAVETISGSTEARLRSLEPKAGTGLWFSPYVEISPSSIRFPLDVLYLDSECAVLATVESFPLASPDVLSKTAGSVLVLQANTVAEGEIRAGDRLILAAPEEMMERLQSMKDAKTQAQRAPSAFLEQFAVPSAEEQGGQAFEDPARSLVGSGAAPPVETAPVKLENTAAEMTAPKEATASPREEKQPWRKPESRNWFTRLVLGDPVDPRRAPREPLPGLVAYFFTGGTPVAHQVRDISTTGMFIVTSERWYPGTVVRITLTDRHNPVVERSITVNAKSARWGSDGVGLEFLLEGTDRRKSKVAEHMDERTGVDLEQLEDFLRAYRASPRG